MRKIILILSILFIPVMATAATDYTCYNSCLQRKVGGYQYCLQACSYEDAPSIAPTYRPAPDFSAPFWGLIQGLEDGRRARQTEELLQLEREKLELERDRIEEIHRKQELENEAIRVRQGQQEAERLRAFEYFITNVKPKVVAVHPDFDLIMKQDFYWQWAEKQRPALKFAAMDSPDPDDIIWAISEYKKFVADTLKIPNPIIFNPSTPVTLTPLEEGVQP